MKSLQNAPMILITLLLALLICPANTQAKDVVESSYHGQLGRSPALGGWGNGLGMLEKLCALPNFSFEKQGRILLLHPQVKPPLNGKFQ